MSTLLAPKRTLWTPEREPHRALHLPSRMSRLGRAVPFRAPCNQLTFPRLDAVGAGSTTITSGAVSENHTINANASCLLAVGGAYGNDAVSTALCGSTAMTLLATISNNNATGNGGASIFGLMFPPTGLQTIKFSYGTVPSYACLNSFSYFNVRGFGTNQTSTGTAATTNSLVATNGGQGGMVFNVLTGYGFATATQSGYTQTSRYATALGSTFFTQVGDARGATSITFSVTYSVSGTWNIASIAIPLLPLILPANNISCR